MAGATSTFIQGLAGKLGVPGKRKYDTKKAEPTAFEHLSLKDKLKERVAHFRNVDKETRIRRNTTYYMMALYYQGYQNLDLNPTGDTFTVYEREDFYVENQFRKHVDTVKQMLNKMEGDVVVRPGSDQPQDIATARVADSVLESMRDTVGYEKIKDQKNLYKCLFGSAFVFTDYVIDKKYGTIVSPKYSYEEMPGPMDELGQPGEPIMSKVASGTQKRNKGSEITVVYSPLEINVRTDIKGGIENLPYLQCNTRQDVETINYIYPGLNVVGGTAVETGSDLSQQYLETLNNLPGNILGDSPAYNRSMYTKKVELSRTWLQPCTFMGDKELTNNFPDGVHVVTVNGEPVDWYPESLTDRWTMEVLIPVPHSLMGDGLYDAILMQDQLNEINSLLIQHLRYSTVGHKIYDASMIDPQDVVNDPKNGWIPARPGLDKNIGQAVKELAPTALSGDVPAWRGAVLTSMQDMTSAYDPTTGKGIGANTPYSQSVFLNEKAQSRWAGSTSFNHPSIIQYHRQLLQIAKDNWIDPRRRSFQSNTGEWSFEQFTQADLQGQVDIVLTNTDMKPKSRAEQLQGLQMLVEIGPLLPTMPPRQRLRIEEMMGLPPNANPTSNQVSRAFRHIDRIRKGEVVSPLPLVDDAIIQVPVFQDFMASEEGETLAMENPEAYSDIYVFMVSLLQMGMMAQNSPVGGVLSGTQPQTSNGTTVRPNETKQPGGQIGQTGGGPNSASQPNAQSPAQPAPPVSPPAPS